MKKIRDWINQFIEWGDHKHMSVQLALLTPLLTMIVLYAIMYPLVTIVVTMFSWFVNDAKRDDRSLK